MKLLRRREMVWIEGTGSDPMGRITSGQRARIDTGCDLFKVLMDGGYAVEVEAPPTGEPGLAPPGIHPADPSLAHVYRRRRGVVG